MCFVASGPAGRIGLTGDVLTLGRLIILPSLLVELLGGPMYLFVLPYALFALVLFASQLCLCVDWQRDWYTLRHCALPAPLHGPYNTVGADGLDADECTVDQPSTLDSLWRGSRVGRGVWVFLSVLDMIFSFIALVVAIGTINFVFLQADGLVDPAWRSQTNQVVLLMVLCGLALLTRACLLVAICLSNCFACCRNTLPPPTLGEMDPQRKHKLRLGLALTYLVLTLVSLGYCSAAIHDYALSASYRSVSTFTYDNCDAMCPKACALPFPSSQWLVSDTTTVTGLRVSVGPHTLPYRKSGAALDPTLLNQHDGFSVSAPILWHLPGAGVLGDQLCGATRIAQSVLTNATTVLFNLNTRALHAHFSETDYLDMSPDRLVYSTPATALPYNTRMVVVVQLLVDAANVPLPAAPLFQTYRQAYLNQTMPSPTLLADARYQFYASTVFPALTTAGITLSAVQLVFDFHTASKESLLNVVQNMARSTIARVAQATDAELFVRTSSIWGDCTQPNTLMASSTFYTLNVPWFLQTQNRDNNSLNPLLIIANVSLASLALNGQAGVLVQVPCSLALGTIPLSAARLVEFGHGIFGDRSEAFASFLREEANTNGWIFWSMDWRGVSTQEYGCKSVVRSSKM
jgi:hypothetical protein